MLDASQINPTQRLLHTLAGTLSLTCGVCGKMLRCTASAHKPVTAVCRIKKVYSSMGTQPMVTPVTRRGSYHHTPVATR